MTTTNPFDRPVWASLTSTPGLAKGGDLAKRYRRDVNLFASARDDADDASLTALAGLVAEGESVCRAASAAHACAQGAAGPSPRRGRAAGGRAGYRSRARRGGRRRAG